MHYDEQLTNQWRERLPKRLRKVFGYAYREDGLIDGCKYVIACAKGYRDVMDRIEASELPVRSFAEAERYLEDEYEPIPEN